MRLALYAVPALILGWFVWVILSFASQIAGILSH